MSNFFGFKKPRVAGFGSPDIPRDGSPLTETADEDVVLEGVIVDYGEADRVLRDGFTELPANTLPNEDINAFLQRMMGIVPEQNISDTVSGTFLVEDEDEASDDAVPTADEDAGSVSERLASMGTENDKLEDAITQALRNLKP